METIVIINFFGLTLTLKKIDNTGIHLKLNSLKYGPSKHFKDIIF